MYVQILKIYGLLVAMGQTMLGKSRRAVGVVDQVVRAREVGMDLVAKSTKRAQVILTPTFAKFMVNVIAVASPLPSVLLIANVETSVV